MRSLRPQGTPRESQHARHVQVVGLEGDGEGHHVEVAQGRLRLKRKKRRVRLLVLAHLHFVRQKDALAGNFRNVVENFVNRVIAEIRHPDAVHVRVAERDAQTRPALHEVSLLRGEPPPVTFDNFLH